VSTSPRRPLRVMVVDDSAVARQVLTSLLSAAGMEVQVAHDPLFAQQKMDRFNPDVVVLDLEMPRMDGLTFLRKLQRENPVPVVVCSGTTDGRGHKALIALEEGAVEVVTKPKMGIREFLYESAVMLVDAVNAAARARSPSMAPRENPVPAPPVVLPKPVSGFRKRVVAIGASTGGPEAIRSILERWPEAAPPVVVVQHMPEGFTRAFANRLNELCGIRVHEAEKGEVLEPGMALIAPGGRHLLVRRRGDTLVTDVIDGPLVSRHRPSVDVLFESVAEAAGRQAVGALLTGMGDDGARGLTLMKSAGAATLAQDEASSVVFGMPKAAIEMGAAGRVASLETMTAAILKEC
jgi:two-component system chemotaxis response regulator CheB